MNVEVRNEAHLDIADGVAFYDRQGFGTGDYFCHRIFVDIESLSETAGTHEMHPWLPSQNCKSSSVPNLLPIGSDRR